MAPEAPWKVLLPPQRGSAQQAVLGLRTVCCVTCMPLPCWVPVFSPVALGLFPKSMECWDRGPVIIEVGIQVATSPLRAH